MSQSSTLRHYLYRYRRPVIAGLLALVIVDALEIVPPILMKKAVDTLSISLAGPAAMAARSLHALTRLALLYLLVAFVQGLCRYGWRMYLIRASMLAGRDLRKSFVHHVFGLGMSFFDRQRIGDLMSLATSDVEAVRLTLGSGILVFADALFYFLTVPIAMYLLSPRLTLIAFLPLPIIPLLVMRNEKAIHDRYHRLQAEFSRISALVQESLSGIRVIKAFGKENVQIRRIGEAGEAYVARAMDLARVQTAFGPTLDFTMSLGLVLLLYFGGGDLVRGTPGIASGGALTLGTFVAFQRYIQKMVWPMAALGMAITYYQRSVTSSERLKEVTTQTTDVPEARAAIVPPLIQGHIRFENLSFRYPGTERDVLHGITLEIKPGERIAVVGGIGSGKSALLSLLPRLYPVGRGMLFIDGIDINDWALEPLRHAVGYVGQDVFLFSETVLENVAYGLARLESERTQSSIEQATRMASVHEDVLGLLGAYETRLGERGVNLSGGQKQRLTIARALTKEPPILVLDDALSSVDIRTEESILKGLAARPGRRTEIIAAHRVSTIRDAHRIIVLKDGRIQEQGTHEELLRSPTRLYQGFYEQQQLRQDLERFVETLV